MKANFAPAPLWALAIPLLCPLSLNAEDIFFSWWDPLYRTPGLFSRASGGYTRQARLPGQEDIVELTNDSSFKTNQALISILVLPKGSDVIGPDAFTARAQTDFGKNHAQTQTLITGFGESSDKKYFDRRSHSMSAESIWSDRWTFSGPALGTASVTLSASFDVDISDSPCATGTCGQVGNPVLDREGLNAWWYRIYGSIRVFDLDIIDEWIQPDSDFPLEVPREITSFEVFQQGSNIAADSFGSLEPYPNVPNKRLTPIHAAGTATFVPVPGHHYALIGHIKLQSREGADLNAGNTLSLDSIKLGPGLQLHSFAVTNGAQYEIKSALEISANRNPNGSVSIAFPTASGLTYFVETTSDLSVTSWTLVGSQTGTGETLTVVDTNTSSPQRFYRLRVD